MSTSECIKRPPLLLTVFLGNEDVALEVKVCSEDDFKGCLDR